MNKSITTVREAYKEYTQETIDANGKVRPSIQSLDEKWGMRWRGAKSTSKGQFYGRREPLWKTIALILEEGTHSVAKVLLTLECWKGKKSLRALCDTLRDDIKEWSKSGEDRLAFTTYLAAKSVPFKFE